MVTMFERFNLWERLLQSPFQSLFLQLVPSNHTIENNSRATDDQVVRAGGLDYLERMRSQTKRRVTILDHGNKRIKLLYPLRSVAKNLEEF